MSEYTIEKGIPLSKAIYQYPLNKMDVGDSFVAPEVQKMSVRNAIERFKTVDNERRFATRKDVAGVRVFRTK